VADSPEGVLAWTRTGQGDRRAVAVNFSADEQRFAPPGAGAWVVEVASDGAGEGGRWIGVLAPDTAVVLRPA
jgi:hypothetical protein